MIEMLGASILLAAAVALGVCIVRFVQQTEVAEKPSPTL
jgi:hypothetical protein